MHALTNQRYDININNGMHESRKFSMTHIFKKTGNSSADG